ncbi:hypothetical protein [Bartonella sp. AP58NXGY]|uniref:hypothetical protein n=1 Tax=Bartonella sp. AP58NXGY TaxID=3243498 RepID=UPI0035CEE703
MADATYKSDVHDVIYAPDLYLKILEFIRKAKSGHTTGILFYIDCIISYTNISSNKPNAYL